MTTTTTHWTYNNANQISTMQIGSNPITNFTYDANGNMMSDGQLTYTWNRANRLVTTNNGAYNTHYAYTGDGDRIRQTVGGAITDYILDTQPGLTKVLGDSAGNRYMHASKGIHAMYDGADWSYAVQDGLGSVRMEVGASVSASQNYTPYGEVMDVNGGFDSPFGFTGEQTDGNGLQYHRARYYDSMRGIWANQDFLETSNRYNYADNNPTNWVDLNGLQTGVIEGATAFCMAFPEVCVAAAVGITYFGIQVAGVLVDSASSIANGMSDFTISVIQDIYQEYDYEAIAPQGGNADEIIARAEAYIAQQNATLSPLEQGYTLPDSLDDIWDICNSSFCEGDLQRILEQLGISTSISTLMTADYDALDRDHSIPKKFPHQTCSERLRLRLQDEIGNLYCNQVRKCKDVTIPCFEDSSGVIPMVSRLTMAQLCFDARNRMKSRCFPTDPSHDTAIKEAKDALDTCYEQFTNRCS